MSQTALYSTFLTMTLALAGAFTHGPTQLALFVAAFCSAVSLALALFVDHQGNKARARAEGQRS